MVQTNHDAMSCYDRMIIICLAMLVSRKYGVHTNAKTLKQATYRIRTELGVADSGYTQQSRENPIYGT